MRNHKDLDVWNEAIEMSRLVYQLTSGFPQSEQFGLVSQMRRASVSVASNIAEGAARQGAKEFLKFLSIAAGSASELDTQLEISKRVEMGDTSGLERVQEAVNKVSKMLQGLMRSIRSKSQTNH